MRALVTVYCGAIEGRPGVRLEIGIEIGEFGGRLQTHQQETTDLGRSALGSEYDRGPRRRDRWKVTEGDDKPV